MAGLNISLSLLDLNRRQTCSSEKITTWAYISFWFPPSAVVFPALYFLHRQQNKRNFTTPISEMFFTFFTRKTLREKPFSLNVCEVTLSAASAYKRREFWREIHTSLASDWTYHYLLLLLLFFYFIFFFSRVKTIFRSSDWLEFICVWKFSSLVSISQYACLILLFGTIHVVSHIVSCISEYKWTRPLYIILAFFLAF